MTQNQSLNSISLYIHFPWCVQKCPYCDFNSHQSSTANDHEAYITNLLQDFETHHITYAKNKIIKSIFLGGGTPSLFSAKNIYFLLSNLSKIIQIDKAVEITLEANPGTIERGTFRDYHSAGINRVSLGVQSFQDDKLKQLGRIHSGSCAVKAIEEIHQSGIHNFNIDIMHGLPNQNISDALYDLKTAINLKPTHMSWYQLTIEPNTLFFHKQPILPTETVLETIENEGKNLLLNSGFEQYEVSAYALNKATESVHNKNYWLFGDYIGIGAGAHSKITQPHNNHQVVTRLWKHRHPKVYLNSKTNYIQGTQILSQNDIIYEFMLNALRLKNGFSFNEFETYTQLPSKTITSKLFQAKDKGLINIIDNQVITTTLGYSFLNDTINIFA